MDWKWTNSLSVLMWKPSLPWLAMATSFTSSMNECSFPSSKHSIIRLRIGCAIALWSSSTQSIDHVSRFSVSGPNMDLVKHHSPSERPQRLLSSGSMCHGLQTVTVSWHKLSSNYQDRIGTNCVYIPWCAHTQFSEKRAEARRKSNIMWEDEIDSQQVCTSIFTRFG